MEPVLSLYISTTLDGYIARADGAIDWLTHIDENNTDYGYAAFYDTVDAVIMGSTTYELISSFGPWPYEDKPTFVFTRRTLQAKSGNITFVSGDPAQVLALPAMAHFKKVWLVGGSSLIASCQKKNLIDEYILTILPVLLGHGLKLFSSPISEQWLLMVSCQQYKGGVLQLQYKRKQ